MLSPMVLDLLAGRHCCKCEFFQPEGNVIRMNKFCITGYAMWETWLHYHFWNEVKLGNLGLDWKRLLLPVTKSATEYIN